MVQSILASVLKSVPSVQGLAMRRAAVERHLLGLPPAESAQLIEQIASRAAEAHESASDTMVALASLVAHRRTANDAAWLDTVADAARDAGLLRAASLCGASPGRKSLAAHGRLPEVAIDPEGHFPSVLPAQTGCASCGEPQRPIFRRFANMGLTWVGTDLKPLDAVLRHPSAPFVRRLLRTRWIEQRDVLRIAARRPSTPELILAIATDDRWFFDPRVRAALTENPFTPAWLAGAIRSNRASIAVAPRSSKLASLP